MVFYTRVSRSIHTPAFPDVDKLETAGAVVVVGHGPPVKQERAQVRIIRSRLLRQHNPLGLAQVHNAQLPLIVRQGRRCGVARRVSDIAGMLLDAAPERQVVLPGGGEQEQLITFPGKHTASKQAVFYLRFISGYPAPVR